MDFKTFSPSFSSIKLFTELFRIFTTYRRVTVGVRNDEFIREIFEFDPNAVSEGKKSFIFSRKPIPNSFRGMRKKNLHLWRLQIRPMIKNADSFQTVSKPDLELNLVLRITNTSWFYSYFIRFYKSFVISISILGKFLEKCKTI